jgi:hypothetical protein
VVTDGVSSTPGATIPYGISDDPNHVWNDVAIARSTMTRYGDAAFHRAGFGNGSEQR